MYIYPESLDPYLSDQKWYNIYVQVLHNYILFMFRFYRMSDRQILENAMDRNRGSSDMGSAMRWDSKEQTNKPKQI